MTSHHEQTMYFAPCRAATHTYNLHGKAFLRASVGSRASLVGNGSPLARY